ncbi:MAG TPA: hypothetical protein VKO63_09890 [Chitinispirillaceae bacterium]|nr:hypothetical protein [Chitinispirillaceae bacterium]
MAKKVSVTGIFLILMFTVLTGCKEDSSPVSPVVSNGVVGTWVDEDSGLEYTFNTNGTITGSAIDLLNALVALGIPAQTWTYNATQILIDGQPATPYTVNDNKLSMKGDDGKDIVLTRK